MFSGDSMHLYISAERENTYFIDTIKEYCANSHGQHSCVFLLDIPSLPGETFSRKMVNNILDADLIFLDATPKEFHVKVRKKTQTEWLTDPRIIAEYVVAVTLGKTEDMKVYCLVSPNHLQEIFRERIVEAYPVKSKAAFLKYINDLVSKMEQDPRRHMRRSRIGASYS
jgi:hypothetical protein